MVQYSVKFKYKEGKFYKIKEENVFLNVEGKEKNKHKLAEKEIKKKYPDCTIINVEYC